MKDKEKGSVFAGGSPSEKFLRKLMNSTPDFSRGECRITFEVGKGVLIEGFKSVCEYGNDRIILSTFCRNVIIEGSGLCICRLLRHSIVICGCISSVSFA